MPPTTVLLPWIDRALAANKHPSCEEIVTAGRHAQPPKSWGELSIEVSNKSGGYVTRAFLYKTFGHVDETEPAGGAA